ncbi:PQQ-dependent sugar dehydrogenase [Ulvibacter antarcticus]|nr:PQQ-dependent sugar dehydrogenase [Ulvibacter antarcticus]
MKKLFTLLIALLPLNISTGQNIEFELVNDNLYKPLALTHANDDRLFVVEQTGLIKIIYQDGTLEPIPFLNIASIITSQGEQGLLGLAFHPNYITNGYFFVNYSDLNGHNQISRYSVDPVNPNLANPNSELPLLLIEQPGNAHNGGSLAFGPDDYLYISSGDGGSSFNAQKLDILLGKLLRIDIDNPSGGKNYGIPSDNPFAGSTTSKEEIWAYGLRNPWKFSFDFDENNLWIGDVGLLDWEEINKVGITEAGLNYGWRCWEGNHPAYTSGSCPPINEVTFPIAEYPHGNGVCAVTGGYVYRGSQYPSIQGVYFFADYCSGVIGTIDQNNTVTYYESLIGSIGSFGTDVNGELYILQTRINPNGAVLKLKGDTLGVYDNFDSNSLSITPNPASEMVAFQSQKELINSITIYDLRGTVLINEENLNTSEKTIAIEALQNGMYLVQTKTETGKLHNSKLIIE